VYRYKYGAILRRRKGIRRNSMEWVVVVLWVRVVYGIWGLGFVLGHGGF